MIDRVEGGVGRAFARVAEIRARIGRLAGGGFRRSLAEAEAKGAAGAPFAGEIEAAAGRYGLDPRLVAAVAKNESAFDPRAVSPKGARGLMQIMPETAAGLGLADPFDPSANLDAGARYLRALLDRYGSPEAALAAYNAGPAAVDRHGGVPPFAETRAYVARVMADWAPDGETP